MQLETKNIQNRKHYIQAFELEAKSHYHELGSLLNTMSPKDISHIILCCSVHWSVRDVELCVPGTDIKWSKLIQQSIIFPYLDNCFLFPFTLVWGEGSDSNHHLNLVKTEIENYCKQAVNNLKIKDLFLSFDFLCSRDLHNFGILFESLFVSSLSVKYYIVRLSNTSKSENVYFSELYDFCCCESDIISQHLLSECKLNLSEGIFFPNSEAFADDELPAAVVHNKNHHNAHHDILLPTSSGVIAVSVKASFDFTRNDINKQWMISKKSNKKVTQLVWLYLGSSLKESREENVAFLNGSGVCNGLSIDMFILVKKLKSQNNISK